VYDEEISIPQDSAKIRCVLFHADASKDTVLYDSESGGVVLLDFESMEDNRHYLFGVEGPEISIILEEPNDCFL
jgi:hypothetical protein